MTDALAGALSYAKQHRSDFITSLKTLVEIPSVSTDPEHQADMQRTANWLAEQIRALGAGRVEVFPTAGHPVVYGEILQAPGQPTVLVYGHYDVQPADPVELWESQPFDPTIRGDYLYARGASDMKGQIIVVFKAIESIIHNGSMPVNVKFILEGEEEIGSPHLKAFIEEHKDLLACDMALNPDAGMIAADLPTIIYALRGLAYFEIRVVGPDHDLHSGVFGGLIQNPANALAKLIAGMTDDQGRITLPGFYDKVVPLSSEEKAELARLPMDDAYYLKQTGAVKLFGEAGFTSIERVGARPTLDVNGMFSGFTGQGSKTVIPSWAMAKVSMRLVPNQDPEDVYHQLQQYMQENAPDTIRWEIIRMSGGPACFASPTSHGAKALHKALETVWGKRPTYKREGGSVPVVSDMQEILGIDSVLTGFGLPDDNIHSPNEKLHLPTWSRGIDAMIHFFFNLVD
ncbi:MAG TPA: dipeptidase [Anaerolineaceae bacterium]|nr:dipeptidase [Anaerolineaceae bacterium]